MAFEKPDFKTVGKSIPVSKLPENKGARPDQGMALLLLGAMGCGFVLLTGTVVAAIWAIL